MVVGREVVTQKIIKPSVEMSSCHFARVLHLEGAGGGVARVGKQRLLVVGPLGVEALEYLPRHKDLSTYFKLLGPVARL